MLCSRLFPAPEASVLPPKMTGRKYIGIELDHSYCEIATDRLNHVEENEDQLGQLNLGLFESEATE